MDGFRKQRSEIDYLGQIKIKLEARNPETLVVIAAGPKEGFASAHLRTTESEVTVDHGGRRLTVTLRSPSEATPIKKIIKEMWRTPLPRWPCLEDKDPKPVPSARSLPTSASL